MNYIRKFYFEKICSLIVGFDSRGRNYALQDLCHLISHKNIYILEINVLKVYDLKRHDTQVYYEIYLHRHTEKEHRYTDGIFPWL